MNSQTVGIGECAVSNDPRDVLVTHGLGSCIAVLIYDPFVRVAGLLHYMLPASNIDPVKGVAQPCMFADTGIPLLFRSAYEYGAEKSRLQVTAVGGAQIILWDGAFDIGKQNRIAMGRILLRAGVSIHAEETGGFVSRTVRIEVATGRVLLRIPGESDREISAQRRPRRVPLGPS